MEAQRGPTTAHTVEGASTGAFDASHPPARALIDTCVHCGFCLPTCPTYVLWGEEMDSPRGRIYLMSAGLDGRAAMSEPFVRHFDACLGCMGCVTACPSGVQYGPLIEATRAQIERRHTRSFADRLFRTMIFWIVPYPWRVRLAMLPLALWRLGRTEKQELRTENLELRTRNGERGARSSLIARLRAAISLAPATTLRSLFATVAERTPARG